MGLIPSNITNNPYVQSVNQTVVSNITSGATGAVNGVLNNVQGALGGIGSIASSLAGGLASAGASLAGVADVMTGQLDLLLSGSTDIGFFTEGSPERIAQNALINRNFADTGSNPETCILDNQASITGGANYQYPSDLAPYYMTLNFYDYQRPNPFGDVTLNSIGSVVLPLPNGSGFVDNTTANWTEQSMGNAGNAYDNLQKLDEIMNPALSGDLKSTISNGSDVALFAASKLLSGMNSEAGAVVQTATGLAPNPSLGMLFNGVGFRSFSFSWMFAPQTADESNTIRDIINFLKQKQLPTFSGAGSASSASSLFFNYPALCKPKFSLGQEFMTQFKYCVIKSINVSYAPQGEAPSFYASTKAPVFVALAIELEEISYVLSSDYGGPSTGPSAGSQVAKNLAAPLVDYLSSKSSSSQPGG